MNKELIQEASTIVINEVNPRLKRGGILPNSGLLALLIKLKQCGKMTHIQLRKCLEAEMFKENWDKSFEEMKV